MSVRVPSGVAKASPPALSTKILRLNIRIYGAARFSAFTAIALSFLFSRGMIRLPAQHAMEHCHLSLHTIIGFLNNDTAGAIQDLICNDDAASNR